MYNLNVLCLKPFHHTRCELGKNQAGYRVTFPVPSFVELWAMLYKALLAEGHDGECVHSCFLICAAHCFMSTEVGQSDEPVSIVAEKPPAIASCC